jgi:hypothetical protein
LVGRELNDLAPSVPEPTPIARVSPSLAESLRVCGLRAAFSLDRSFVRLRRPSPASALGLASHELTEAVSRGRFDAVSDECLEDALEEEWDLRIESHRRDLEQAWSLGAVPSPNRWPGYGPTRRRLLRRLAEQARSRRAGGAFSQPAAAVEEMLEPDGIPLRGQPDRVEASSEGPRLVDLKSGWTVGDELRPAHRRQLLTYSFLWHAVHGEWPASACIQRLDGARIPLEVDPEEAKAVVAELIEMRDQFNASLVSTSSTWQLASPSPDACLHCDFKGVCPAFFEQVGEDWGYYRRHVLGTVSAVQADGERARVDISTEAGNLVTNIAHARVVGLPTAHVPNPGARVSLVDALPTPVSGELRVGWDSAIEAWHDRPSAEHG